MVGVYLDVFLQHIWGKKLKTAGSMKTTKKTVNRICHDFVPLETFMVDSGSHFKNKEVQDFCDEWGIKHHIVTVYSPWVNGLVEGMNRLLLYVLTRLCTPEVGEDSWQSMVWEDLPKTWLDHFNKAILILNWQILPVLKFALKELMLGMVVNMVNMPLDVSMSILMPENVDRHMMYAAEQRLDGYAEAVCHTI
jgi:transposase InsO family protein